MIGLVNSVVNDTRPPTQATIQPALFATDPDPRIALAALHNYALTLERQLRDSETAYEALCDYVTTLEAEKRNLDAHVRLWRSRAEMASHVNAVCALGPVRR